MDSTKNNTTLAGKSRKKPWRKLPNVPPEVKEHPELKRKRSVLEVANEYLYWRKTTGKCFLTQRELEEKLELDRKTVQRAQELLERLGILPPHKRQFLKSKDHPEGVVVKLYLFDDEEPTGQIEPEGKGDQLDKLPERPDKTGSDQLDIPADQLDKSGDQLPKLSSPSYKSSDRCGHAVKQGLPTAGRPTGHSATGHPESNRTPTGGQGKNSGRALFEKSAPAETPPGTVVHHRVPWTVHPFTPRIRELIERGYSGLARGEQLEVDRFIFCWPWPEEIIHKSNLADWGGKTCFRCAGGLEVGEARGDGEYTLLCRGCVHRKRALALECHA